MNNLIRRIQGEFARDFTLTSLRGLIIIWAVILIIAAMYIKNKWILAGLLAYEILP